MLRYSFVLLLIATGCGGNSSPGGDAGATDSGTPSHDDAGTREDAGTHEDAGTMVHDAGTPTQDAGPSTMDAGPTATTGGLVGLYQATGSVDSLFTTTKVTLLVPIVAFVKGTVQHGYDDQQNGFGCTGDHYDSSHAGPADAQAGAITISGYAGGDAVDGNSSSPISCTIQGPNYACQYSNGIAVVTDPYTGVANPLGSGPIMFSGAGGSDFGSFTLSSSPAGTLTVTQDLSTITYSTTSPTTLTYLCGGSCSSSVILVSLLASQNATDNPTGTSSTTGAVSCVGQGTGSITIPAAAIAAMFGSDTSFQSVTTTVIRTGSNLVSAQDAKGQTVAADVGEGVFGIAPK